MSIKNGRIVAFLLLALLACLQAQPVSADDDEGPTPGILTPPTVDDGIIYFVHWPNALYAFDEDENESRWTAFLDPLPEEPDLELLPAPAPISTRSYILVHIGRQLWGISKLDGKCIWSVDGLPEASYKHSTRSADRMPGFYFRELGSQSTLLTLEESNRWWYLRRRNLGDGTLEWQKKLTGTPRGWWFDRDGLWIAYEQFGETGPVSSSGHPAVVSSYDPDSGQNLWSSDEVEGASFRASFRADPRRFYLLEKNYSGDFEARAFNQENGDIERSLTYSRGDFIAALATGEKVIFLHREGPEDSNQIRFTLYWSSLNAIQNQTLHDARPDQHFPYPEMDNTVFLNGGEVISLYDGNRVWGKNERVQTVGFTSDDFNFYFWDAEGFIFSLERLTGDEIWRTQFNVLPPADELGPNYGGASFILTDNRLFATTAAGELFRIDPETGEAYPGTLKVTQTGSETGSISTGEKGKSKSRTLYIVLVTLAVMIPIAGFIVIYIEKRRRKYGYFGKGSNPGF